MWVRNGRPRGFQDLLIVDAETFLRLVGSTIVQSECITTVGLHNIFGRLCSDDIGEDSSMGCQLLSWALENQGVDKDTYPSFRDALVDVSVGAENKQVEVMERGAGWEAIFMERALHHDYYYGAIMPSEYSLISWHLRMGRMIRGPKRTSSSRLPTNVPLRHIPRAPPAYHNPRIRRNGSYNYVFYHFRMPQYELTSSLTLILSQRNITAHSAQVV